MLFPSIFLSLINIKSSFSPHTLEDCILHQQIPLPIPTRCWQMLSKTLALANLRPLFFPLFIELAVTVVSIGCSLLETLCFLHVHGIVHPAFLFPFPSQNALPASSGSLPCYGQVVFMDLSLALPHSPASGQSHLYQWLHLEFRRFSKRAALDVSLACQTQQDWSRAHTACGRVSGARMKIASIILATFFA